MRYHWIFFDADGTLFDFEAAEAAALERAWTAACLVRSTDLLDRYRRINGELWRRYEEGGVSQERLGVERFVRLAEEMGVTANGEALSASYIRHLGEEGRLLEGAEELLRELAGVASLALVTNGIAEVQRNRLSLSGVEDLFSAVVISGEVGVAKPDRRFFDAAFEAAGGPRRSEVVIVGDSLSSDIRGGLDYGIDTCWYAPAGTVPEAGSVPSYVVRDFDELRRALGLSAGAR